MGGIALNNITDRYFETADLKSQFHYDMQDICKRSSEELGYKPKKFLQMLGEFGGVETVKKLIECKELSYGFTILAEKHRLDLSAEAYVIKEKYKSLFTDEEREVCRTRLEQSGYSDDGWI